MKPYRIAGLTIVFGMLLGFAFIVALSPVSADLTGPDSNTVSLTQDAVLNGIVPLERSSSEETAVEAATSTLCRLGFAGANVPFSDYPPGVVESLRGGWLFNWSLGGWDKVTTGMRIAPSINVKQLKWDNGYVEVDWNAPYAVPYTYTVKPSIDIIKRIVSQHPGNIWLVGNEIERRDWPYGTPENPLGSLGQGEILPEVYAVAYHEIYHAIKTADPTAKVANGSIIFPSPLRLEYLTQILDEYEKRYHTPMPVDVWQIHLYLIPEQRDSWVGGADIPVGLDDQTGMFADFSAEEKVLLNKDFSYVPGLLRDFRGWMKDHGQQNKPLIISEMAVLMPDWIMPGEFTPIKIRDEFLYQALDFVFHETDPNLGYPLDDYRLVQSMWWWSFDMDYGYYTADGEFRQAYNGNLAWSGLGEPRNAPNSMGISELGQYWAAYVAGVPDDINLRPIAVHPAAGLSHSGEPVTVTVNLKIVNSGNVAVTTPFTVRFMKEGTSTILASATVNGRLEGCGEVYDSLYTPIPNLAPGMHTIRVIVDYGNQVPEVKEYDNDWVFTILVSGHHLRLPLLIRR